MNLTINNFWKLRIKSKKLDQFSIIKGWRYVENTSYPFTEAPLRICERIVSNFDPNKANIIIVSAPGAVGKSTLAKEISAHTEAIYIDLSQADPVGGNTILGGLAKSNLYNEYKNDEITLLIDGLDEARLKVTQESFESFLSDIIDISKKSNNPIVLFGRTGASEEAWLHLNEKSNVSILEIEYYKKESAVNFVTKYFDQKKKDAIHREISVSAISIIIEKLITDTESDGDRFAGYAPVLYAIASHVAQERNPAALIERVKRGETPITPKTIVDKILEREAEKINTLSFEDNTISDKIYKKEEQLDRLAAYIYNTPPPETIPMNRVDFETYTRALENWLPDHPFIGGEIGKQSTQKISSIVFEAAIVAHALRNKKASQSIIMRELSKGKSANPFLATFYKDYIDNNEMPPGHIGAIYLSLRTQLSLGDSASLSITSNDNENQSDEDSLLLDVELTIDRHDADRPIIQRYRSSQIETISIGSHLEDIDIYAPLATIEIGGQKEATLISPINIQCHKINISSSRLVCESVTEKEQNTIYIESDLEAKSSVTRPPTVNGATEFWISWPGGESYPWSSHYKKPKVVDDPNLDEALRRFRKFIISFRSHSKGSLKRFADKLEHARMTKKNGIVVLEYLKAKGIVSTDGTMYTLHQDALSKHTGASYGMCMSQDYPEMAIDFIKGCLSDNESENIRSKK